MATSSLSVAKCFSTMKDPRSRLGRCYHHFLDIIVIAICGVICGCDNWEQIQKFGEHRRSWLERFLKLANGIPSYHTFKRVFSHLNPDAFQRCFVQWTQALCQKIGLPQVAIDGKTLRGSRGALGPALHMVSAWATESQLSLGQVAVEEKSNEITAIPRLLELLDVHGALVTIDAMGCQKEIAREIRANGGDYILTVKDNQPNLLEDIQNAFGKAFDSDFEGMEYDTFQTEEKHHGREERRSYTIIYDPQQAIRNSEEWIDLCVIGMCHSERTVNGKPGGDVRYFIGSRKASAEIYGNALRNHWRIENCLHWQLDVSFAEDASRIQDRNAAANFGMLRRIALNLLKQHPGKGSIATKRLQAAWDTDFLEDVLHILGKI
jgi:predicted transposase YbfD/YdcC